MSIHVVYFSRIAFSTNLFLAIYSKFHGLFGFASTNSIVKLGFLDTHSHCHGNSGWSSMSLVVMPGFSETYLHRHSLSTFASTMLMVRFGFLDTSIQSHGLVGLSLISCIVMLGLCENHAQSHPGVHGMSGYARMSFMVMLQFRATCHQYHGLSGWLITSRREMLEFFDRLVQFHFLSGWDNTYSIVIFGLLDTQLHFHGSSGCVSISCVVMFGCHDKYAQSHFSSGWDRTKSIVIFGCRESTNPLHEMLLMLRRVSISCGVDRCKWTYRYPQSHGISGWAWISSSVMLGLRYTMSSSTHQGLGVARISWRCTCGFEVIYCFSADISYGSHVFLSNEESISVIKSRYFIDRRSPVARFAYGKDYRMWRVWIPKKYLKAFNFWPVPGAPEYCAFGENCKNVTEVHCECIVCIVCVL